MAHEPVRTIASFYDAYARRDIPALLTLLHPEVELHAAENFIYAGRSPYQGPQAVNNVLTQIATDWDHFLVQPQEILGDGDTVIVRGRYQGTFRATGYRLDAEFVHVFRLRDGKIVRQQTYTDTAQFRDAVQHARSAEA
jgi:ketosteroid isomerase-like protein